MDQYKPLLLEGEILNIKNMKGRGCDILFLLLYIVVVLSVVAYCLRQISVCFLGLCNKPLQSRL